MKTETQKKEAEFEDTLDSLYSLTRNAQLENKAISLNKAIYISPTFLSSLDLSLKVYYLIYIIEREKETK